MDKDNSGFTEEEILELSEYDEEWGHFRTTLHPDSMKSSELLKRIEGDPNHEVFHQYVTGSQALYFFVALTFTSIIILLAATLSGFVTQTFLSETFLFFLAILSIYFLFSAGMYFYERRTDSIIINALGIGWKKYGIAIEWSHVEWIDIGMKNGRIERIIFSGNRRSLFHDNDRLNTKFTLTHLHNYLPDFESWKASPMPGWPEHYSRHTRPRDTGNRSVHAAEDIPTKTN
ncbi:MAG: hypothetical protein ACFFFD_03010 [Promethearchaeota archaeon]